MARQLLILVIFLLTGALYSIHLFGQSSTMFHYSVTEGLPSNEVYDIFQDSKGFLWISTDNGVVQFDGYQMKLINIKDNLPDPVVFETMEDANGRIWFRTYSGRIAYYENDKITLYPFNNLLSKACEQFYLVSMGLEKTGKLWFTTSTEKGALWGTIEPNGKIKQNKIEISSIWVQKVENSYIIGNASYRGYNKIKISNKDFPIKLSDRFDDMRYSNPVRRAMEWRGNLYISANNNLFKYNGENVELIFRGHAPIISLTKDKDDNLWIGYFNGGVTMYSREDFKNGRTVEEFDRKSITKVIQDKEGGYWIATREDGIYHIPNFSIKNYIATNSKIQTIFPLNQLLYTGETDGDLSLMDPIKNKSIEKTKFSRSILSIFGNDEIKIVSMAGALYIFDRKTQKLKQTYQGNYIDFSEDKSGNIYGIELRGVSKFNHLGDRIWYKQKMNPHRTILCVDSTIIIGLHTGLQVYDTGANHSYSPKNLSKQKISDLSRLTDTTILISTVGSGFLISNNNFSKVIEHKHLAQNIYASLKINSHLWLGTEKGILKIEEKTLSQKNPKYEFITQKSGLLSNKVNLLAASNSNILAFYDNSFSIINQDIKNYSNKKPKPYIKKLTINNHAFNPEQSIKLPHDSNNVQLEFGFISFNNQDINIRYKLKKADEWIYSNERTINFFTLSPGTYSPELQYSADGNIWSPIHLPEINIRPPWWQTATFQIAFIIIIITIAAVILNNRIVIYRHQNEKMKMVNKQQKLLIQTELETLERERIRIAKDLHDSVSPNILAAKLITKNIIKKYEPESIESIESQFQAALKEIKSIVYDLEPPGLIHFGLQSGLKHYIDRITSATAVKVNLKTEGDEMKDSKITIPIFRILQELISNTLKHSQADHINLSLEIKKESIKLLYTDNGLGFDKTKIQPGLGLNNIESRVLTLNGIIQFNSGAHGVYYEIDIPINV